MYPALAILQAVQARASVLECLWVCGEGDLEVDLVKRERIPFVTIPAAGIHGVGWRLPANLLRLWRGFFAARNHLDRFKPEVLLFTGGYLAVPVALAGRHIPSLLYVPDIEPGLALRTLALFADRICLIAEESRRFFKKRAAVEVTGHPTRSALQGWNNEAARQILRLDPGLPTLLVFGGSKGARSINRAVLAVLEKLLSFCQVIHISGSLDWPEVLSRSEKLDEFLRQRYQVFPYLHEEMGAAYSAADLILSRAGASSIGEFPLYGKPAILVPYPHAWRYQKVNADYLVAHGAARMLPDDRLQADLVGTVQEIILDEGLRNRMAEAMRSLGRTDPAATIAGYLFEMAGGRV